MAKSSQMKGQFGFSDLHLFSSVVRDSTVCKHFSFYFLEAREPSFVLASLPCTKPAVERIDFSYSTDCLGQDPKW